MTAAESAQDADRCCSPRTYTPVTRDTASHHTTTWQWLSSGFRATAHRVSSGLAAVTEATGAPWWLTIAATGASVRLLCFPAVLQASAVGSNMLAGKRSAMRHTAYLLGEPAAAAWPTLADHEARRKRLAPQLAPGPTKRAWLALPLVQVSPLCTCVPSVPRLLWSAQCTV